MPDLDLRDEALFCELPDPAKPSEENGRSMCMDGSLADAYIEKLRELRPEHIEYSYSSNPAKDFDQEKGLRLSVALKSNDCFRELEKFILDYLHEKKPVRRFPSSKQVFWSSERLGEDIDLDYFYEMNGGRKVLFWNDIVNFCVLNDYRRKLEKMNDGVKHLRPYFKRRNTFVHALVRLLIAAAAFAASVGIFRAYPLEPVPTLICALLSLTGVFFLSRWGASFEYKSVLRRYYERLNEGGQLTDIYCYARFCQLWCQAEGREMPETLNYGLDELKKAVDRCQRIARFYPELVQQ